MRLLRLCPLLLIPAIAFGAGAIKPVVRAAPGHHPQRIVSLNLCADQYVLALADPEQIAGLTRNAADREMSAAADRVGGIHIMGESAEEVLNLDPDLIVGVPGRRSGILSALSGRDYATLDLTSADDYRAIVDQIREVATAVGHPARGEALIRQMDADLAAIPRHSDRGVAAYYQRRGFLTGTGTLVDDLMVRAGLTNLAGRLGKPSLSQLSLEEMMAAQPDYLIVESATARVTDQGTEMLHHPILKDIPRISLPQAWTVCGGPAYVKAAQSIVAQLNTAPAR